MNSSVGSEIVTGFIGEVEGYLPDMSRCLQTLQEDRTHRPSLAELHRITHTIKGAAAMVGLDDLSGIGEILEKVMENVLGASLVLDDETITLLGDATQRIDSYCMMQRAGRPDDGKLFQKTVAEIEEKICKSTVGSDELERSSEDFNPETLLFQEDGEEENSSEADMEDELLFQDIEEEEEEGDDDDLFGSAVTEFSETPEEILGFGGIEQTEQTGQEDVEAEEIDPELLQCFSEETDEHLENIDSCLNSLDDQITDSVALTPFTQETLHSLRRSVHTLKGAAAVIGIEQVAAWGHDFEDFLDWLHDEARRLDPAAVAALRDGADLLASLAEEPTRPAEKEKQRIIAKFTGITEAYSLGTAASGGDKVEDTGSSLVFDEAENALDLSEDSTADFFAEGDSEELGEADSFLDEIASSVSQAKENVEDDLFFQDVEEEEEEDLFGFAVTEHPESSEESIASVKIEHAVQGNIEAEAIDPELLECFREETEEHLENIDSCLNSLDDQITDLAELTPFTQETLHSLRRSVHTLKGAAAVIGIEQVAAWGHDFEDFLDWLHDEARRLDPTTLAALRDGADLLASLAEEPTRPTEKEHRRITRKFTAITEAFFSDSEVSETDEAEHFLELSQDSTTDLFAEDESEGSDETGVGILFDEIPVSPVEEARGGELLFQDADEEEDSFVSVDTLGREEREQHEFTAEAIDPELLECFREETEEHLENIDACLNRLGVQITAPVELNSTTRETLHSLRRSVHTLKGAAAVIGIEQIAAWGHDFEDFLDWLHDDAKKLDTHIIISLREGADLLAELAENPACPVEQRKKDVNLVFKEIIARDQKEEDASSQDDLEEVSGQDILHKEEGEPREFIVGEDTRLKTGDTADNFFDELPVDASDDEIGDFSESSADNAVDSLPEAAKSIGQELGQDVHADQQKNLEKFSKITADNVGESSVHNIKEEILPDASLSLSSEHIVEKKGKTPPRQQGQAKKAATLRVDVNRIDQMVGLSGDMVINLSSFEDSMDATAGTMKELDMILQRLKNINSSLEAGYELASIPHLGSRDELQHSGIAEDFDPLEMDRYSELNILIRSLSEAVSDLDSIMAQNALDNVIWQKTVERQGMVLKELQNRMMGVRMTPLSTLSSRMHRTVREAERTTGHPARLTIEGESIMMDTRVWDVMADPLMHILRNAVAHGGSLSEKANWNPLSVTIRAIRKGGQCTLRVSDNGKGLDYEAIRLKGMKLYPNDRVNLMSDSELAELIFRHGFSSTGSITNIAGRGVGMDVVRDAIDQLNGSIELVSERGQGTEFIMHLPVSVAQLPVILARFGVQIYAIPMHDVASIARATPEEKKGREYTFDGESVPLLHPAKVPGFDASVGYVRKNLTEDDQAILIVHAGRKRAAVLCEQLIGKRDVVFKDLGTHLQNVPCISGVTIMGNGDLIPILQVEEVLQKWSSVIKRQGEGPSVRPVKERGPLRILVVDDSISVRKVVSNFIVQQGWIPVAARNGIEAVEKIREEKPDVVLLDVEMPRMNGFEVLQTLQAQPELRGLPVAMLTSRSADKYQKKARELGARGFMTKPFKAEEVIGFILKVTADE